MPSNVLLNMIPGMPNTSKTTDRLFEHKIISSTAAFMENVRFLLITIYECFSGFSLLIEKVPHTVGPYNIFLERPISLNKIIS